MAAQSVKNDRTSDFGFISSFNPLSVNPRHDTPGHFAAIGLPILTIFLKAHRIVTPFSMDEQNREIKDVEIRQRMFEACWQTPRQSHQEVTEVVEMPCNTPPAGSQ